jgi:nucleotide-binding universal stress UspA family protein
VPSSREEPARRVVVGVDGSPSSVAALEWAARQAELTGATLEAVTTWEWPRSYGVVLTLPSEYDPAADARTVLEESLEEVTKRHPDLVIVRSVVEGPPAAALVDASQGAQILVVGSRGHSEISGILIGSVSDHCATSAHCPVLVYRHQG